MNFIDLSHREFGRLRVLKCIGKRKTQLIWRCLCVCGKFCDVHGGHLRNGHTQSCGCFHREQMGNMARTHGKSKTLEYRAWRMMRQRCTDKNSVFYKYYGARGITVCERWNSYEKFFTDMGPRPSRHHSLDRIDNNGNYCKENCRWATSTEQNRNKRNNRMVTFGGSTLNIAEWSERSGVYRSKIAHRVNKGLPLDDLLGDPINPDDPF